MIWIFALGIIALAVFHEGFRRFAIVLGAIVAVVMAVGMIRASEESSAAWRAANGEAPAAIACTTVPPPPPGFTVDPDSGTDERCATP
jgi:hypothetical protein